MPGDTRNYAAMATPVTSAQVAKAWVRPDRRFAAVSWSRRRGKMLATWSAITYWRKRQRRYRRWIPPLPRLFVEPDVFHAPTIEDAVDHDGLPLHIGLPATAAAAVKD